MEIKIKSYSSQSSLLSSIFFFLLGGLLFTKSNEVLKYFTICVGAIFAIIGTIRLILYIVNYKKGFIYKSLLITSILSLIISIIFIFFAQIVEQFIRFIVGGWILFSGIMRLINTLTMEKNKAAISTFIVSFLLIGIGIYTIVIGDLVLSSIGLIMMIYAGIEIIGYIFYSKNTYHAEIKEELIPQPEDIEKPKTLDKKIKRKRKIKDVKNVEEKE